VVRKENAFFHQSLSEHEMPFWHGAAETTKRSFFTNQNNSLFEYEKMKKKDMCSLSAHMFLLQNKGPYHVRERGGA
jgi:hypothetical protein